MDLQTKVADVSRVYKIYARRLEKLGIRKVEDFLYHIPFRYDDFRRISKISDVVPGETVTIQGKVLEIKNQYARRFTIQKGTIGDGTGVLEVTWFNQPYIAKTIDKEDKVSVSGKVKKVLPRPQIDSPDFEILNGFTLNTARLVPIYPETRGVSSKWLRRQVYKILNENKDELSEFLPNEIIVKNNLMNIKDAVWKVHFPENPEDAQKARKRLSFDEFFLLNLSSLFRKKEWESKVYRKPFEIEAHQKKINELIKGLPFELTNSQKKAVEIILSDFKKEIPMNRLLQGEVGSGKTVVAAIAMYLVFLNGYKSIFMAPTEILANQHFDTVQKLLSPYGIKVGLITGSKNYRSKTKKKHDYDIYVGTHALLYKNQNFEKLGFVVIDEQQRFGVEQRSLLRKKGESPNFLTMTATPIPRTVALTMYGNLSLSFLSDMPKERKRVKTWLIPEEKRNAAYSWIEKQIRNGDQAFVICPFIDQSESLTTIKAAAKEFERLKDVFSNLKLGLLHGRLKAKEKQKIMNEFRGKNIDILIATPVVEVGIDFPNATVILIEASERFGLAQLHQLRGRVGRGEKQSYCLLFTDQTNPSTIKRLKSLETLHNGAELAELDLKLRGPGQVFGTMQHGIPNLKVASFSNLELIEQTKKEAEKIFPHLSKYSKLVEKIKNLNSQEVSPD